MELRPTDPVPVKLYYQLDDSRAGVPSPARQARECLTRQRAAGVRDFDFAWRQVLGKMAWPHDHIDRRQWVAIFADPTYIDVWRCAFERRSHRLSDAHSMLAQAIEADDLPGYEDAPDRETRRRSGASRAPRLAPDEVEPDVVVKVSQEMAAENARYGRTWRAA